MSRLLIPAVLLGLMASCGDGPAAPEPDGTPIPRFLAITGSVEPIFVGATRPLSVSVRDGAGREMGNEVVRWTSRDSTTAAVDPTGTVTGIASGEAWIVASAGPLTDSIRADVRFDVAVGEARVRVTGEGWDGTMVAEDAASLFLDVLGRERGDVHFVVASGSISGTSDGMLLAALSPTLLPEGETPLSEWPIEILDSSADSLNVPIAFVGLLDEGLEGPVRELVTIGPPARVEIAWLSSPPGAGPVIGELRGRLVGEGAGYEVRLEADGRSTYHATGRRYRVAADFRPSHRHLAQGGSEGSAIVDGTSLPWSLGSAWWSGYFDGRTTVHLRSDEADLSVELDWPHQADDPSGRWSFRYIDEITPRAIGRVIWRTPEPHIVASSALGTLEITRFVPPTTVTTGELSGRLDARFLSIPDAAHTVDLAADFAVPIPVQGGATTALPGRSVPGMLQALPRLGSLLRLQEKRP